MCVCVCVCIRLQDDVISGPFNAVSIIDVEQILFSVSLRMSGCE